MFAPYSFELASSNFYVPLPILRHTINIYEEAYFYSHNRHCYACTLAPGLAALIFSFNPTGTNGIGPGFRIDNLTGSPDVYDFGTAMAFTSGGKILVAGYTQKDEYFLLVRYTNTGELDNSFGSGGFVEYVRSLVTLHKGMVWPCNPMAK